LTSYEDVRAVLRNEADYAPAAELYAEIFGDPTVLGADNPRHAELRGIWGPALLRGAMKSWVDLVAEICDPHLDPALDRIRDGDDRGADVRPGEARLHHDVHRGRPGHDHEVQHDHVGCARPAPGAAHSARQGP